MNTSENMCPCCSMKKYKDCCQRFHNGSEFPKNALQLMRSRFSAYALNLPDYIIETTHPDNPHYQKNKNAWKRSISQFSKSTFFQNLEILNFNEDANFATVTFTAYILQGGKDATFTEKSYFNKSKDRWLYHSGIVTPNLDKD